ncbi:MAG: TonB-dependent receptor plug domain-containing protein, partial [Bacteroidales bacterium]|nr:TonB-dependent receptor plug domain-containing protein [Bacteroidales bacterium]
MRKGVFLSILVMMIVPALPALGQRFTISGYVEDGSTGEKLIAASVYDTINGLGTTTNEYGFYSLTLDAGEVELSASFVGYGMFRNTLNLGDHKRVNIVLDPNLELEEVTITTNRPRDVVESSEMSTARISVHEIKSLPVLLGEADILKTLQLLPGVQSGTEGTSGIYVRGGGPDQNLILLDGVPVYNADHLFGFFSVFNPDAISSIKLTKGGFPAHYGGRLSSVIDIRMKEGNMKEFSGAGSIGLISSKLMLEGPIVKDRTSFIITGRRTYIDILARPVIRAVNRATGDDVVAGYYFYDANLKINHKFSDRDRIYMSAYTGKDKTYALYEDAWAYGDSVYTDKGEFGLYWGNTTTVLRWNHVYGNKLFSNLSAFYSRYKFDVFEKYTSYVNDIKSEEYTFDYFSGIE